ncbi:MAG TPA: DinB family protein [Blastocatellia bacterium]|nr:DinB family protein [Blastocatellia bacterium]
MNKQDIATLFDYNRWANAQMLDTVARLTPEQLRRDLATSHHSVHETLTHILAAEWIWLMRCRGVSPKALLDPNDFADLDALKRRWAEVEQGQQELIDELSDERLDGLIAYTNTRGEHWEYPLGQILQHVFNHSTYHRGQVTAMLRQLGAEVVMTDFLVYMDRLARSA